MAARTALLPRTRWLLASVAVTAAMLAALAVYFRAVHVPRAWEALRADVLNDLGESAAYRASSVASSVADAFGDARTVADYPSVHLAVAGRLPASEQEHLRGILTQFVGHQEYRHVEIFDSRATVVSASLGTTSATRTDNRAATEALRSGVGIAVADAEDGAGHVDFAAPILEDGKTVGAVVLDDASDRIALALDAQSTRGDIRVEFALLVGAQRDAQPPVLGSSPVAVPDREESLVRGSRGEMRNRAGDASFAVSVPVPGVAWRVVAATRTADVRAAFERDMRGRALTWTALVLAAAGSGFLLVWGGLSAAAARFARSQARLSVLLDRANDPILIADLEGRIQDCNKRAVEFYGHSRESLLGLHVVGDMQPPTAHAAGRAQFTALLEHGHLLFETEHRLADGRAVPVEINASVVMLDRATALVAVVRDVSERQEAARRIERLNRMLRTVSEVSQMIVRERDASHLLGEVCRIAVEEGGFRFAWIGRKEPEGLVTAAALHGEPGVNPKIEARWDDTPLGGGPTGTAIRAVRTVTVADVLAEARMSPWHERLQVACVRSLATTPIRTKSELFGALTVYRGEVGVFEEDTLRLLEELATDVGFALQAFEDRAARHANETALAEQRHLFQRITELSPVLKYVYDTEQNRYVYANRQLEDVLGYPPGAITERSGGVRSLVHPDDCDLFDSRAGQVETAQDGEIVETECRIRHRDGSWRWLYSREIVFARRADGRPRLVLGVVEDLTSRKNAEDALRRSETQLRAIFDTAVIGIVLADGSGRLLRVNGAMERILGYSLDELDARGFDAITHPEEAQGGAPRVREALDRRPGSYTAEKRTVRRDGTAIWTAVSATAVRDDAGRPLFYVGLVEDVSDRRMLQEQLLQSQKMESIGRLAGGVAHDFNNLLTAIMGYTEMLRQDLPPEHPGQTFVDEVSKAGARAAALTTQLLAFARRQVIEPRVVDLNTVVVDAEKMLRRLVGEDVEIVTSLTPAIGAVEADPSQVHQILVNLAVNARDAMPAGGTLSIGTSNVMVDQQYARAQLDVRPGPYVMLSMSDTGIGMPREVQEHLFEPFFTTKELGKGTGLGLATCHGIVKQAGGHITVTSEPGRGTTFRILLPRVERVPVDAAAPAALPPLRGGNETVLVVEDESAVRSLASLTLRGHGYTVLEASTGREALGLAERDLPVIHLLVSDVVMPGLNGPDLAERFQAIRPGTPVLFISGHAETAIAHQGVLDRGVEFLAKPFTPDHLARRVREILDRRA